MATTTAQLILTSTDLLSNELALSTTSTLTTAGTSTGLTETSGIGRHTTTATAAVTIFSAANFTDDNAHKVYILNTSTTASEFIEITIEVDIIQIKKIIIKYKFYILIIKLI